jgi:hypothetical protein
MRLKAAEVHGYHLGELGSLISRDVAGYRGGCDARECSDGVGGICERRRLANQRLVFTRGQESIKAQPERPDIASHRELNGLVHELPRLSLQLSLHLNGCLIARPAWPAGRVAALAFLELHVIPPFPMR